MADRLQAYADWLVQNQDKRGTTEFETVANAYKQLRQQPVDRSYSSAFQQSLDAPLENMATTARMLGAEGTADTLSGSQQLRRITKAQQNGLSIRKRVTLPSAALRLAICPGRQSSKQVNLPARLPLGLAAQQ